MQPCNKRTAAFTLLEISIVLAIIALVIGAILMGRGMIRSSQLNAVLVEKQEYVQAAEDFRSKYLALPGDFKGATALWGTAAATPANCKTTAKTTATATCDGNGNGFIDEYNDASYAYEQFRAWEHLNNAGFLNVKANGVMTATYLKQPGVNLPPSKLSGAGWALTYLSQSVAATQATVTTNDTLFKHVLWFGGASPGGTSTNQTVPPLSAAEAKGIDDKIDDGNPGTGTIVAQTNVSGNACISSSVYNISASGNACSLVFKTGF